MINSNTSELKCLEITIESLGKSLDRRLLAMQRPHTIKMAQDAADLQWAMKRLQNKQHRLLALAESMAARKDRQFWQTSNL